MPSLCLITVPGLEVSSEWRLVHDRLLDEFPDVMDVLPTTMRETILVVHGQADPADASRWLDTVSETLLHWRRGRTTPRRLVEGHRGKLARDHWGSPAGAPGLAS